MDRGKIGFVVGLTAEMALFKGVDCMCGVGGGTPDGAADVANFLIDEGAEALVSFGLAGGLNPGLAPGAVLVPGAIVEGGHNYICDPDLLAWLGGATCAAMFAGETIAVTATEKANLFARTGADAIDLESGAVARVASSRGVKFAVLRAVCDPAGRDLPPAALIALDGGGKIGMFRVLGSVLRQPGQVLGLLKLAGDAAKARRALQARLNMLAQ